MKRILFVVATLALLLSACGPQATPTIDPVQIQASAIAAANTMVAMTLAAVPTATPIPPTPVPSPTLALPPTPIPLPTLAVQPSPTVAASSSTGTCNHPMDMKAAGPTTPINIRNKTSGRINGSIYTVQKNAFGECGTIYLSLAPGDSTTLNLPLSSGGACYWAYVWVLGSKPGKSSGGPFCLNTVGTWYININLDSMSWGA